jgi:membrane protease YdiL (CAAX protease family)
MLFSMAELCGPCAILLQAVLFTLAYFGKPYVETPSCILRGTAFGAIVWKTRSIFHSYLIHVFTASLIINI